MLAVGSFLVLAGTIFTVPETFGGSLLVAGAAIGQLVTDYDALKDCY